MKWMVLDKVNFDAYKEGDKLVLSDPLQNLETGEMLESVFANAMKALNNKKQDAGFSNLIAVRVHQCPIQPIPFTFLFGEQSIKLNWMSPTLNVDGSPITRGWKNNVYRTDDASGSRRQ